MFPVSRHWFSGWIRPKAPQDSHVSIQVSTYNVAKTKTTRAIITAHFIRLRSPQYAGYTTRVRNPPHWRTTSHFASVHEKVRAHVSYGLSANSRLSFGSRICCALAQKKKVRISLKIIWYYIDLYKLYNSCNHYLLYYFIICEN